MIAEVQKVRKGKTCYSIKVCCPFCKNMHLHGGGDVKHEVSLGSRAAHCGKGEYEMKFSPPTNLCSSINAIPPETKGRSVFCDE
jgi:hypothetical protein